MFLTILDGKLTFIVGQLTAKTIVIHFIQACHFRDKKVYITCSWSGIRIDNDEINETTFLNCFLLWHRGKCNAYLSMVGNFIFLYTIRIRMGGGAESQSLVSAPTIPGFQIPL